MKKLCLSFLLFFTLFFSGCKKEEDTNKFIQFHTTDLYGNEVSNDIFSNKDLTIINVWGTYCSPCIQEMPILNEWAKLLPDNVQIIGLVCDVYSIDDTEQVELAKEIVESLAPDYLNIIAGTNEFYPLLKAIPGTPTTFFVDSEGNFVADAIVGADINGYINTVKNYMESLGE